MIKVPKVSLPGISMLATAARITPMRHKFQKMREEIKTGEIIIEITRIIKIGRFVE